MTVDFRHHNEEFDALQSEYLKKPERERDSELLGRMYQTAYEYSCNVLIQYTHKKGIYWSDWVIEEKAKDMASWLIEPYLRKPEFRINKLSAYAHFAKLKILYRDKDYETKTVSYESLVENGGDRYVTEQGEIIDELER